MEKERLGKTWPESGNPVPTDLAVMENNTNIVVPSYNKNHKLIYDDKKACINTRSNENHVTFYIYYNPLNIWYC